MLNFNELGKDLVKSGRLKKSDLLKYLVDHGFCKLDHSYKTGIIVRLVKNRLCLTDFDSVYGAIKDDFYGKSQEMFDLMMDSLKDHKALIGVLPKWNHQVHSGNPNTAFLYFDNSCIEISVDEVHLRNYEELDVPIWEASIIKRPFQKLDWKDSEFKSFVHNVCNDDERWILCFETTLGYLLHNYKDPTCCPAVVLTDEDLGQDKPEGRRGKSLTMVALKQFLNVTFRDGKNCKSSRFYFQGIDESTDLVCYDDLNKKFDFQTIFAAVTGDLVVENKGYASFTIPRENAPRFLLSTNHLLEPNRGGSHQARIHDLFYSDHYYDGYGPNDEFGHRFFEDWDSSEWNRFDNFMVHCIQQYLKHGLIKYIPPQMEEYAVRARLGGDNDLYDFFNKRVRGCYEVGTNELYDEYCETTERPVSPSRFSRLLTSFGKAIGTRIKRRKSNGKVLVEICEDEAKS